MAQCTCAIAAPSSAGESVLVETSIALLSEKTNATLDRLELALSKLGGADAPSQGFGDPAAGRALALMAAGVEVPETVQMDTDAVRDHLLRLFGLFSGNGPSSSTATDPSEKIALPGPSVRMTPLGFRKLVRAAQLTCKECTDVDVDLIYQQVVRTRGARMAAADFMVAMAMVAKRLYPGESSQSAAFHRLLSDSLLPWMLQVRAPSGRARTRARPRVATCPFARHRLPHAPYMSRGYPTL